jgi:hypothetical protein
VDIAPKRIPVRRRYQYLCQFTTERRLLLSDYLSRRGVLRGVRSIEALVFEDVVLPPSLTSMLLPPMPPFQMPCFTDVSCCCTTAQNQEATSAKPGAARTWGAKAMVNVKEDKQSPSKCLTTVFNKQSLERYLRSAFNVLESGISLLPRIPPFCAPGMAGNFR